MKTKKPFYKKWQFLVILLVLSIIVKRFDYINNQKQTTVQANKPIEQQKLSLDEQIKKEIVTSIGDKNNLDKKRIRDLKINDNLKTEDKNDKIVMVYLNADDNLSSNMIKTGILINSKKIFEKIFSLEDVSELTLCWDFPLVDQYGNSNDELVVRVGLKKDTASKINWETFIEDNFKNIADQYFEHASFNK